MSFSEKNRKINNRQSWEGEPNKFSFGNMWVSPSECDEKYTKEMRLEARKRGVYIDTHCLENDDKINNDLVIKYTPYDDVHLRELKLLRKHPGETIVIAGEAGLGGNYGQDNSGIAMSFAEAGGKGIDRGGLAFSFYQKFDEKRYKNEKKGTESWHGPLDGTQVNAARHTLWNMLNIQTSLAFNALGLGSIEQEVAVARSAVDLHEANPYALENKKMIFDPADYTQSSSNPDNPNRKGCAPNQTPTQCALAQADETTDLLNNQIGRNLGLKYSVGTLEKDLALGMLDQFYFDGLYTIQKIGRKYHVVKTRISEKQYEYMKNVYINELDHMGRKLN